ncbi:MAG: hypothetical protein ORO02_04990 [Bacteroidia bacterium]|nr:hypothetical protein [Bacteroidia bacterium]
MDSSCQALAFWLGYQESRSSRHNIREIAVVTELLALLDAKVARKQFRVHCETKWGELIHERNQVGSLGMKRADITITKNDVTHLAIEVKKIEGRITQAASATWTKDLSKLCKLKMLREDIAIRLILVSNHTLPNEWITPTGRASRQIFEANEVKYRLRRILKALPLLPSIDEKNSKLFMKKGHSVVIIEPIGLK